jgi:hypothetical protein
MGLGDSFFGFSGGSIATLTSILAIVFSGYSLYETALKQADLRLYRPPLIYLFRENERDVLAIPITVSNDGASRATVLSFDLDVVQRETNVQKKFQNLHFGESPKGNTRLFTPITVQGRSSFSDVVLFSALSGGAFFQTTGSVKLPLRFTLKMNVDSTGDWFARSQPPAAVFDMTANYIESLNQMESGRPTLLHDDRWIAGLPTEAN